MVPVWQTRDMTQPTKSPPAVATRHTCGGPVFGQKTPGCPRCDELLAGAEPVRWAWTSRKADDLRRSAEIHEHFARFHDGRGNCAKNGRFCTFGDH